MTLRHRSTPLPVLTLLNARLVTARSVQRASLYLAGKRIVGEGRGEGCACPLEGHLILPGLINAHDHLPINVVPPLPPERRPICGFANSYAWMEAFQEYLSTPEVRAARAIPADLRYWQGGLKNLFCGVTTVAHHDPFEEVLEAPSFPVRLLRRFGWCHTLGLGLPDSERTALRYGPEPRASFAATPSTQPWIIHLAEGRDSIAASELTQLEQLGCLASNTVLVHGVGLTPEDKQRILKRRAGVIWCPGSNLKMLGQTLDPSSLLEAGRVALGSDSRISGSFHLLHDLALAAQHPAVRPQHLCSLVTESAKRLLRMRNIGSLEPGHYADLLILRDPGGDPYEILSSLQRSRIRAVIREGMPAWADPDFADWFDACGIPTTRVCLDGRLKLCATALLGPAGAAALEPGLETL